MPTIKREQLRNELRRREIAPVYVLFGAETHLRDLAVKTINDLSFQAGEMRDFNETEFSLNTPGNLTTALASAEQLPMMASRRVIRITDVRVSATGIRDTLREDDEAALAAYLAKPSEFSVVIFVADELDKRRKITKILTEGATAVEFFPLEREELSKWVRDKIRDADAEIDDRGLRLLLSLVGPDARRLTVEIEKLATAALPEKMISSELITSLVANNREISNFDLTDHLFAGRKTEAMKVLKKILDDGAEPVMLLGLISSNVRRLSMAKAAMEAGMDRGEVGRIARVRYSDLESFMATARRTSPRSLAKAMHSIAKADLAIKTSIGGGGPIGSRMQIEILVAGLSQLT